jgi:hypothetical protein
MKIKLSYKTRDELPKGMEELYDEVDGEFRLTGVEGMKTGDDVTRVQQSLVNERKAHKETREKLATITQALPEGMTADQVVEKLDQIEELEAQVAAAKGKGTDEEAINRIVETRVKRALAPVERERDQLKTKVTELGGQVESLTTEKKTGKIDNTLRGIAADLKVIGPALDDVLLHGRTLFELDEAGRVVTKDGIEGVTPGLDPKGWLTDMQEKRPHWWALSEGGGAHGSGKGVPAGGNPWSSKAWNMTAQGNYIKEHGIEKANQLAKQAGTTVGGPAPKAA